MLWRLFVSMLIVSDTGSVAVSNNHSDWPSEPACITAVQQMYAIRNDRTNMMGHTIQVRVEAKCVPVMRGG